MELPEKPCASIDARLRDWDVLLGFRYSPTWQRQQKARSVIFGGPVGGPPGTFDETCSSRQWRGVFAPTLLRNFRANLQIS